MSEKQYLDLLEYVLGYGVKKTVFAKNGKTLPTINKGKYSEVAKESLTLSSVIGVTLRFDPSDNKIPLYTSKAVHWLGSWIEMWWFLNGKGDLALLNQLKVPIWNGWGYQQYLQNKSDNEAELSYSDFVKTYLTTPDQSYFIEVPYTDFTGWKYPDWEESFKQGQKVWKELDQTKWLIDSVKKNPDRKSYVVTAWNPTRLYAMAEECGNQSVALAACHCEHQVIIQDNKLILRVTIRSNDLPLGNPFNVAQYGILAHMYAKCIGYPASELVIMITDAHIYSNQVEGIQEQIKNVVNEFQPTIKIEDRGQRYLTDFEIGDIKVNNYYPVETIRMPLTIVGGF